MMSYGARLWNVHRPRIQMKCHCSACFKKGSAISLLLLLWMRPGGRKYLHAIVKKVFLVKKRDIDERRERRKRRKRLRQYLTMTHKQFTPP